MSTSNYDIVNTTHRKEQIIVFLSETIRYSKESS